MALLSTLVYPLSFLVFTPFVLAHDHYDELTEEQVNAPIDSVLWAHIFLQVVVWGILFPIGMVLGITRSRWHVPLQVSPNSQSQVRRKHLLHVY